MLNCGDCETHLPASLNEGTESRPLCPECSRWQGRAIVLRRDHPYVKMFNPSITGPFETPMTFRVCWRDFSTMKQEQFFETQDQAEAFRANLLTDCHMVRPWLVGDCCTPFEELNAAWADPEPVEQPEPPFSRQDFYRSRAWRQLRYQALRRDGGRCACCGRTRAHGVVIHVDHIEPRSKRPDLELTLSNLQVLCDACNLGKGAWDNTDWRARA